MIKANFFPRKCFRILFSDFSDIQLLEDAYASLQQNDYVCKCCGQKGMFSPASSYSRSMITVENGSRKEDTILIRRFRCSCGHCHAVIPEFLIPYGSYTIRFVLHVLKCYLNRTSSVSSLCDFWQISVSTLYEWIHRFRSHFNLLSSILKQIHWLSAGSLDQVLDTPDFVSSFLQTVKAFSFLQHHPTSCQPPRSASGPL